MVSSDTVKKRFHKAGILTKQFDVVTRGRNSSVEIGLNPEKIRRKLILVSLDSKFFTEQHIQNPLKSPMGKIFYTQFSLKHMKSLKMSRIFVYTCVKNVLANFEMTQQFLGAS